MSKNYSISQIRIQDAAAALDYYEKTLEAEVVKRHIAKNFQTPLHVQKKLIYGLLLINEAEIIISENYEKKLPKCRCVYLIFENSQRNILWIKEKFAKLSKDAKKILVKPSWNRTNTFYCSLIDKFDVQWEFKIR